MTPSVGSSHQLIGLALVPASAAALTWATLDGERVWPVAVLSWIVGLWASATRVHRDEHGGV